MRSKLCTLDGLHDMMQKRLISRTLGNLTLPVRHLHSILNEFVGYNACFASVLHLYMLT